MSSRLCLERGQTVVGGHLFSPLLQKRALGHSVIQESSILPCDRIDAACLGSPLTRKDKDIEATLTTSSIETDSIVSSCMLTSESFYCQVDGSVHRCETSSGVEFCPVANVPEVAEATPSVGKMDMTPVNDSPRPKLWKQRVNWGDRHSIRLSIEYLKSMANELTPKVTEKASLAGYFKICFGTEFSDEDDDDDDGEDEEEKECQEDNEKSSNTTSKSNPIDLSVSVTSTPIKPKRMPEKVWFLSAMTSDLIGTLETEDGMLIPRSLANLSISQIQLIVNDLLNRIHQMNFELMTALPLRDDLNREREVKQSCLDRCTSRHNRLEHNYTSPFRPNNLKLTDAFNPNPEYRYPFNSAPSRGGLDIGDFWTSNSERQTANPVTVGARLKATITKFFNPRISSRPQTLTYNDTNIKSMSF